ncbi:MAG: GAF domain-containing protein [Phycisphaerae bacterium]|nr:GAF domain-containing protein [Gemmatimonadaceae bacterium]
MAKLTPSERDSLEREILTQMVRDLTGFSASPQAVLQRLAVAARRIALAGSTCVLEIDGETIQVAATSGATSAFRDIRFQMMPAPSLFRDAISKRGPVFTNDGERDDRVDARFREPLDIKHAAVAPIIIDDVVTGLLVCINSGRGGFSLDDMASLQRLADHTALALHAARQVRRAENAANDAHARAATVAREGVQLRVLARTAQVLANALTRDELYGGLTCIIEEELGGVGCSIYDTDADRRTARLEFQTGAGKVHPTQVAQHFWLTRLGQVVDTGIPLFVGDISRNSNEPERRLNEPWRREGIGAVAALPLLLGERARGVLAIRYRGMHDFDDPERQLLVSFATQIAVALRHVGYIADLEVRAERLAALAQAQQGLTRVVSRETLMPAIVAAVAQVVPAPRCDLFFPSGGTLRCVYATLHGKSVPIASSLPDTLDLARATYVSGVPRIGMSTNGATSDNGTREPGAHPHTVELCAPVRFGERSIGVLRLTTADHGTFNLQDLDLVNILARHAGSALETSRLFGTQDLERQRAEAAADIARAALRADRIQEGAARLLEVLDRVVPTSGKALGVARARDGRIEYVAASGTLSALLGHRPVGSGGVNAAAPDGRPFEVATLRELAPESQFSKVPDECGLVVPLIARERALGVLIASMPAATKLETTARTTLERLSASLSLAFDALLLDEEERYARERERMLATALTTMDQPVFILDRRVVRYANPAAVREYGWSLGELIGRSLDEIAVGFSDTPTAVDTSMYVPGIARDLTASEHKHRRRDGSEFPAAMTQNAITSDDGTVVGQVVSVRNMAAEYEVAAQMRHTEKMVALGELVAGVAHEINNPLTGISAFAQLLLEEPLSAEQRESVQLIKRESDRATTVIRDLLLFARKEGASAGPVDVNALLEQTVRLRAYQLRNANVEVTLLLDPTNPHVQGDRQKLQQVLLNVIVNAEHAMGSKGSARLLLRSARDGDQVVVDATDSGVGMSPDTRRRMFEPFYTTKPPGIGTGLGMSVSYGIIQAHSGTIEAHSEPDVGTTISIRLPLLPRLSLFTETVAMSEASL